MSKLVKINDRKPIEIYIGRKTRGPITGVRLSEAVIGRILRSIDAPKDIYAIGPNNVTVKLTLDNYMKPEEELFNIVKAAPAIDEAEAKAKAEALRKSLEAKKYAEPVKPEPVKSEATETVVKEETAETVIEPEVQDSKKVEEYVEPLKGEELVVDKVEEPTKISVKEEKTAPVVKTETPAKNYNNYNKNYNKNNKR